LHESGKFFAGLTENGRGYCGGITVIDNGIRGERRSQILENIGGTNTMEEDYEVGGTNRFARHFSVAIGDYPESGRLENVDAISPPSID
jgi:hypothetical protein